MKGCRWHSLKKLGACGNRKVRRWKFSNCLQISIISTPWRQIWIELNFSPLALPSKECESESCSALSDFLWPHRLYSPWNSPGQNTGLGSLSLLQGICPTQGSNPGLPNCRQILYQLSHKGSPRILDWVVYPFSSRSSRHRNWNGVCIAGGFFTYWVIREALCEE